MLELLFDMMTVVWVCVSAEAYETACVTNELRGHIASHSATPLSNNKEEHRTDQQNRGYPRSVVGVSSSREPLCMANSLALSMAGATDQQLTERRRLIDAYESYTRHGKQGIGRRCIRRCSLDIHEAISDMPRIPESKFASFRVRVLVSCSPLRSARLPYQYLPTLINRPQLRRQSLQPFPSESDGPCPRHLKSSSLHLCCHRLKLGMKLME